MLYIPFILEYVGLQFFLLWEKYIKKFEIEYGIYPISNHNEQLLYEIKE
jgi:hypothetical protein